ncbi:MAG: ABC transporter permease subunit [Brevundimonas sp.]|uniref:ABC transporter permease subunit n=1 Tax=Brevundimonas sp. TaxID=1871086 RepID=UPI00391B2BB9
MLADAIRAEGYRFARNRSAVFWSVLFVPIAALILGIVVSFAAKNNEARLAEVTTELGMISTPLNLGAALLDNTASLAGGPVLLFVLIGAATLFAGDYRWETWRLIRARNRRSNLIMGKLAVLVVLTFAAMAALLVFSMMGEPIRAAIFERQLAFSLSGQQIGAFLGLFGLGWLRVVQFAMIALLAAVATRSLLAALFIPMALGAAQAFGAPILGGLGFMPDSWTVQLLLPGQAFDALKGLLIAGEGAPGVPAALQAKAWISLIGWTVLPLLAALAIFERQDLSKE